MWNEDKPIPEPGLTGMIHSLKLHKASQITDHSNVCPSDDQASNEEKKIKSSPYWPIPESCEQWIPMTKGQRYRKYFHMTTLREWYHVWCHRPMSLGLKHYRICILHFALERYDSKQKWYPCITIPFQAIILLWITYNANDSITLGKIWMQINGNS